MRVEYTRRLRQWEFGTSRRYVRGDRQAGHTAATSISYGDEQVIRGKASDGNRISYSNSSASEHGAGADRMTQYSGRVYSRWYTRTPGMGPPAVGVEGGRTHGVPGLVELGERLYDVGGTLERRVGAQRGDVQRVQLESRRWL